MIRHLTPLPASPSMAQLRDLSKARFPKLIDMNVVDVDDRPNLAVYLADDDATDPAAWRKAVAAWAPVRPTPEELAATALTDDSAAEAFIRAQLPSAVTKAKAILAAPANSDAAHTPTAAEIRIAWALEVLDLQRRYRN